RKVWARSIHQRARPRNNRHRADRRQAPSNRPVTATTRAETTVSAAPQPRRIWLCADDYGISLSVNTAIRDLVTRGRLNATSVLVAAPTFCRSEATALSALNSVTPRVAIGLHLVLTAPFRPLSANFKPTREGAFLPLPAAFAYGMLHRYRHD